MQKTGLKTQGKVFNPVLYNMSITMTHIKLFLLVKNLFVINTVVWCFFCDMNVMWMTFL